MRSAGILGLLAFASIVLVTRECTCAVTQKPVRANATSRIEPGSVPPEEEDDDFVPYQGERFTVFDWMLFRSMCKKNNKNLLVSPISIKMALVLLYEGAQDQTAHELAGVMQLPVSRSATRDKFATILQSLQAASPLYTLNIGTRLYVDSGVLIRQRYEAIIKTFYSTDVINANLSDSRSVTENINSWVSNVTQNKISKMIDDENSIKNSVMVALNALFFKGAWRRRYFAPENTQLGKFYTSPNQTIDVPFMNAINRFYYSESAELDAKILRIPYDGHKFAMYLILPRTMNGLDQLANDINPFIITRHVWLMQDLPVDVSIPKFKFEFSSHLEDTLRELGIRDIFDDTATLTGIARTKRTSKHLKVSNIVQKTGIEVNENGTVAYAATEIQLGNKIEEETFHANHPFLFYIEDESTGTIIYIGKITNPLDATGNTGSSTQEFQSKFGEGTSSAALPPGLNAEDRENFFNIHLLQALNDQLPGNVISSPASVKTALTILAEGTAGHTREELISALRLPKDEQSIRKIAQRTLESLMKNRSDTKIETATRLWIHKTFNVPQNYKDVLRQYYGGDVQLLDFEDVRNSVANINNWARRTTQNKISAPLLSNVDPATRLIVTSVIYFKGQWLKSFDPAATKIRCFNVPNFGCQNTYFMEHESMYRYAYLPSLDAEVLEVPYSDRKTSMLILVPYDRENDLSLQNLSTDLSYVPVSAMLDRLQERDVTLKIPKFNIETTVDLQPALTSIGVRNIFEPTANLTRLVLDNSLQVTNIVHSAKIEINEEGTLAAAATAILLQPLMLSDNNFTLDRPFLFMIVDLVTNTTLFSGRFVQPR